MRRIFGNKRNRYIFANKSNTKGEESTATKTRDFFIGVVIIFFPAILAGLSRISFQVSYWIGLTWRLIIFIPLLALMVIIIRNIIVFLIAIIEEIIDKNVSLISFIILVFHIIGVIFFIFLVNYFKVIPYIEDTLMAYDHNYSSIEGTVIGMDRKYDFLAKKTTVCGVILTIQSKSGERRTITFNDTELAKAVGMRDYCKLEYLPYSMLGMNFEMETKYKWRSNVDEFLHEEHTVN